MVVKSCYLAKTIESEEVVKEYTEKLGCKLKHKFVSNNDCCAYVVEDAIGNQSMLVLFQEPYKSQFKNLVGARINVDNITEAVESFKKDGYEIVLGPAETKSNFLCSMKKGNEFRMIFEHKHNN